MKEALWLGVHLIQPALDAWRDAPPQQPHWVLEQGRVLACNRLAWQAGVRPGMRQAGASALLPEACTQRRDPQAEAQLRQALVLALLPFSPQLAWQGTDTLVQSIGASLSLFGGLRRCYARVQASVASLGVQVRLALAPTADAAALLAQAEQARRRRVLRRRRLPACLDALALTCLPEARAHQAWLLALGCDTLGDLRRLPRAGLQQRQAQAVLWALDRAYGDAPAILAWIAPPASFQAQADSLFPLTQQTAITTLTRRLLVQLVAWLDAGQLAVTTLQWVLHHERRGSRRSQTPLVLSWLQPGWQLEPMAALLEERLAAVVLPAPVVSVSLQALQWQPRPGMSATWLPQAGATDGLAALRDRLVARLGSASVRYPCLQSAHLPEQADGWTETPQPSAPWAAPVPLRPFWLLAPPQPLAQHAGAPVYDGAALQCETEIERIEDAWWAQPAARDYLVARHPHSGRRYWLFYDRLAAAAGQPAWFLHGIYA